MKNIQLSKIILWQKDLLNINENEKKYVEYEFTKGKLNIIHGLSQTGKSAIIPIIDYCLCSSMNKIPIGTIRKSCSWFGIVLKIDDVDVLFARENCESAPKKIMYVENISDIPDIPVNNIEDMAEFNKDFNDKIGVPFIQPSKTNGNRNTRLSFRDLISFSFQPQYIVANPNCLLYKMDTSKYKDLMIPVFNIIIGAETIANYQNRILLDELQEKLKKLKNEESVQKESQLNILKNSVKIIYDAIEYGLLDKTNIEELSKEFNSTQLKYIKKALLEISKKNLSDINISVEQYDSISDLIENIENEISPLTQKLLELRNQRNSLEEMINLRKRYANSVKDSLNRLDIANFIQTFCMENSEDTKILLDLSKICERAKLIQDSLNYQIIPENSMYLKKFYDVEKEINKISEEINLKIHNKSELREKKEQLSILDTIYEKIIIKAKLVLESVDFNNDGIKEKIATIKEQISQITIDDTEKSPLDNILKLAQKYLPEITEFNAVSRFDIKDMTIKVKEKESSKDDFYLWETGSGSNWVAFHIAMLLGFHTHFIQKKLPMFNFVIFDQPSQVYFPKEIKNKEVKLEDEDKVNVKKIFSILNKAVLDNDNNLQVIVTDHADNSIWGDIPAEQRHIVGDWSSGDALIPTEWKNKYDTE